MTSPPHTLRVLILEDNPSDAGLMVAALAQSGFDPKWERVDTEADFSARLTPELDLILSDYTLPQLTGIRAVKLLRARGLDVPFILVSGSIGEDLAVEAILNGADDYLFKDRLGRLGQAVRTAVEKRRLRFEKEQTERTLRQKIDNLSRVRAVSGAINSAIVRCRSRQELLDEACRIAVEHGNFGMAWAGTFDPAAREVTPVAWAGFGAGEFLGGIKSPVSEELARRGAIAQAVMTSSPVFDNDIARNPELGAARRQEAIRRGYRSNTVLPLFVDGKVTGTLALFVKEPNFFDDEEMKLLAELAGNISFALEHLASREKVDYLAYYDPLTALPNRTLFIDRTGQQLRGRGGEAPLIALILINLERFRNVNETLGRHGGDEVLALVARRLERAFRGKDCLARTGADSFGVVIRGLADAADVAHALESQVFACFQEPFTAGGQELRVAARAGVALFPGDGGDADTLFRNAEAALKRARDTGEPYLFYAAEMNARAAQVLSLETRLRKAVEAQQFVLHYQPKIDLASGAICGLEALIRWHEPGAGLVPPGAFIPVLEETGLILETGRWALWRALADHREWTAHGSAVPRIAVNVSAIQLQRGDFADVVINAVAQGGNVPEALELEVTESLLMRDIQASIRKLSILRKRGIHLAMDDFGTGYSSLSYIARLPIDSVKIDRSFINGMGAGPQDLAIVTTILALAHALNLKVVAEGVETGEQAAMLRKMRCDEAQGFHYYKPLPAAEIESLLRAPTVGKAPPVPGSRGSRRVQERSKRVHTR